MKDYKYYKGKKEGKQVIGVSRHKRPVSFEENKARYAYVNHEQMRVEERNKDGRKIQEISGEKLGNKGIIICDFLWIWLW